MPSIPDFAEVRGQLHARRAMEIAAAGGHSVLMVGPPGSGKSMLAARLPGILPPMTDAESLETAAVQSLAGSFTISRWRQRPYRSPHHTASGVALVGGSSVPRPGEISLANHGVLFLDELPEFDRKVLEVLREPLESGHITISRAARQAEFPCRFQLIAAMNPCPCGYLGDANRACRCTPDGVARYQGKISGPLMDRIDMQIQVAALTAEEMLSTAPGEASAVIAQRVVSARERQLVRQQKANARLSVQEIDAWCQPETAADSLLPVKCEARTSDDPSVELHVATLLALSSDVFPCGTGTRVVVPPETEAWVLQSLLVRDPSVELIIEIGADSSKALAARKLFDTLQLGPSR
jgi:magnesium chelatase family protein